MITLALLIVGFLIANLFIRKMTRPLSILADAAGKIDEGRLDLKVSVQSHDEVERVADAFNAMLTRFKEYTQRLEAKSDEINQAYTQTRKSFEILQQIGAQPTIADVCSYMIHRFKEVVACQKLAMVVFFDSREDLMLVTEHATENLDTTSYHLMAALVKGLESVTFIKRDRFDHRLLPADFDAADRLVVVPIHHEEQLISALLIACTSNCTCNKKGLDVIELIFKQTAGGIKRAARQEAELRNLHDQIDRSSHFSGIVGKHVKMKTIFQLIKDTAPTDAAVLIQGESGTGKELVAMAVHRHSQRNKGPFIVINCSAFPATLLESELFGHEKGAFTGAVKRKRGRFEQAQEGTVFLDEIGELSLSAQVKLLRVLQTHRFERIGGEQTIEADVRVISATNKNLMEEIKKGHFREDLFYRLNVIPINLPPLRLRKNDIPLLARHFLSHYAEVQQKHHLTDFSDEAMRQFMAYAWPGNVRELENAVEHSVVLAKGTAVQVADLPLELRDWRGTADAQEQEAKKTSIVGNEKKLLLKVLQETGWNKKLSAQKLGISRSTLYNKLRKYAIRKERRKVADQHRPQHGS
jgi:two-component system response regulator HydG